MKKSPHTVKIFSMIVLLLCCFSTFVLAQQSVPPSSSSSKNLILDQFSFVADFFDNGPLRAKIAQTIFTVLFGYLMVFGFIGIVNQRVKEIKTRPTVRKNVIYIVGIILIIIVFFIWIQDINSITIFLGVAGAGLALALQEVILSVAGWLLILLRHPFETGDRVEINGIKGDVIDIRLFQTSLLEIGNWVNADQSTGRIVKT